MNSRDYWQKREREALKHYIQDEAEYERELRRIYQSMLDSVQREINAFYGKYAAKEGITIAEAKKRVSKLDIAAYERKAKRYVREKNFSAKANEEMRLYNATMQINRLEMLKANIGLELISGHEELEQFMQEILQGRTMEELERQAGILGKTVRNNAKAAHAIVNSSFHNARFSDRIWMYQDLMKADLAKLLEQGLIAGKNPRVLAREIKKQFGTSRFNAERLMRTELARVQTEAQKQSFQRNGFDMFEFIVNSGCCPVCQALSGKHFRVDKMMPGENAPPMHPMCRCSTAAWEDSEEYQAWLDHLANGGTTEEWEKKKEQAQKKAVKVTELSEEMQKALYDFTNGEYKQVCDYSQYHEDPDGLWHDAEWYKKNLLPDVSEKTKQTAQEIVRIIKGQPTTSNRLYRLEKGVADVSEGDVMNLGIRSTTRIKDFIDQVFAGEMEGFDYQEWENNGRYTEYIFTRNKQLDVAPISAYARQEESLICGRYRVVKVVDIPAIRGGVFAESVNPKAYFAETGVSVEFFTSKKGNEMVRYTEDGVVKTMTRAKYETGQMEVTGWREAQVGRRQIYVEVVDE